VVNRKGGWGRFFKDPRGEEHGSASLSLFGTDRGSTTPAEHPKGGGVGKTLYLQESLRNTGQRIALGKNERMHFMTGVDSSTGKDLCSQKKGELWRVVKHAICGLESESRRGGGGGGGGLNLPLVLVIKKYRGEGFAGSGGQKLLLKKA